MGAYDCVLEEFVRYLNGKNSGKATDGNVLGEIMERKRRMRKEGLDNQDRSV